jgi:hypothetical protein
MRHAAGQAFGQVQENLRLNRGAQALAIVVYLNLKAALLGRRSAPDGTPSTNTRRTASTFTPARHAARGEIRQTGHKLGVQQAIKRGVFPVLMLTRRQAETQHLLQMLLRLLRARAALGFKQPVPLLERITAVR